MTLAADPGASTATGAPDVPIRAEELQLLGAVGGSGYRSSPALVRRRDGQTVQLTTLLYLVLEAVDGRRSYDDIAAAVSERYRRPVRTADVRQLVERKLRPLGLVRAADGSEPELTRSNPLLALRCRYVITDPAVTRRITAPFARLFAPVVVAVVVVAFVAVCVWTLGTKGLASATHQAFESPGLLLAVFLVTVLSAGFHEFGHAAAARYGGATPGAMGAGLYLVWPAFYTDVTDSYRLGRGGRLRTDLGGLYFNAIVAVAMFGLWWVVGWDALLLIIATQILQMVRQLTPLVRFDGYHVLADITGVPDLYHHVGPTLRGLVPTRRRRAEASALKPWARAVVTIWVLLVVPLLVASFVLMVIAMPRLAATAASNLAERWGTLRRAVGDGDVLRALVDALGMAAIALTLAAVVYLVARVLRRLVGWARRATAGRPRRRAAAVVLASAIVTALALVWWPGNGDYRPVQATERGTIGDALAAVAGDGSAKSDPVVAGSAGSGQALWPAAEEERPTREQPVLALVMVPADDPTAGPMWVFPFDRPLPPGVGDNQALAVNTTDGTVVYDVAFALVWVEEGDVLNRNEAFAFASCTDCAAVAVGFQVVLAIGQVDVAVPQNIAAAVNYACVRCVAYAIASQLVVTLPGDLSSGAHAQLAALWDEIRLFGEQIAGVPLGEIEARLRDYERRIVEIVRADADAQTQADGGTGTVPAAAEQRVTSTTLEQERRDDTAGPEDASSGIPAPTTATTSPSVTGNSTTDGGGGLDAPLASAPPADGDTGASTGAETNDDAAGSVPGG